MFSQSFIAEYTKIAGELGDAINTASPTAAIAQATRNSAANVVKDMRSDFPDRANATAGGRRNQMRYKNALIPATKGINTKLPDMSSGA